MGDGAIKAARGTLEHAIKDALLLRASADSSDLTAGPGSIGGIAGRGNARNTRRIDGEQDERRKHREMLPLGPLFRQTFGKFCGHCQLLDRTKTNYLRLSIREIAHSNNVEISLVQPPLGSQQRGS
jgi:hypothetical protein